MALRLFILMMSIELFSWKVTLKFRAPFQLRENLGGLIASLSELAAPSSDTSVAFPFLITGFPKSNRSSKPTFSLLPSQPLLWQGHPGTSLVLGMFNIGVAKSGSSYISEKLWSCREGLVSRFALLLPSMFSSCIKLLPKWPCRRYTVCFCVCGEGAYHEVSKY